MLRKTEPSAPTSRSWASLAHLLRDRVVRHPNRLALTFLSDDGIEQSLTYAELDARVSALASRLMTGNNAKPSGWGPGDRALLLFPAGLEFMVGFMACQYARLIPVPTCFPKPGRSMPRLDAAAADCDPKLLLADSSTLPGIDPARVSERVAQLTQIATDDPRPESRVELVEPDWKQIRGEDLGLLQYTSGSTSQPKGVMVSHNNLLSNLESIRQGFGLRWSSDHLDDYSRGVFWLPPFHDMGLIGGILEALYIGGHTVLMSPRSFLARPRLWLETISKTHASISGAPNFAYQLCVDRIEPEDVEGLDLSGLEVAFCGAEPIFPDTLDQFAERFEAAGFRKQAFVPCYGLAESTLLAASGHSEFELPTLNVQKDMLLEGIAVPATDTTAANNQKRIVGCGEAGLDTTIEIVSPESCRVLDEGQIGEIWLQGHSVTQGYWGREETNDSQFAAKICDEHGQVLDQRGPFLRTGDLGFIYQGSLYVTGRLKDVIILRGRNHFPQDIEASIAATLQNDYVNSVAFASSSERGDTLTCVIEVSRHLEQDDLPEIVRKVRRGLIEDHEVDARHVVLTRPAAIPLTTSGKVQRAACRQLLENDELFIRHQWQRGNWGTGGGDTDLPPLPQRVEPDQLEPAIEQIEKWLLAWLVARGEVDADQIHADTPFADYGLDSLAAVELSGELEDWLGVQLTPVLAWNYPTPARLAVFLAEELAGLTSGESAANAVDASGDQDVDGDFERLLAEIEQLPEQDDV